MREVELKAELNLERQLREWEREKLACQPEPQAKVTPTPSPLPTVDIQASEWYTTAGQPVQLQPANVNVLVSSPANQPVQAKAVAAPNVVSYSTWEQRFSYIQRRSLVLLSSMNLSVHCRVCLSILMLCLRSY